MISTLILTRNEELDLPGCLETMSWCDDIHVFDSFSTDRTVAIAEAGGAHVAQRVFDDFATHRNAALSELDFAHPWILLIDADERPGNGLVAEIQRATAKAGIDIGGFRLHRRDYYRGVWLKHAQLSPIFTRVVRRHRARYTRTVNEMLEVDGRIADLASPLHHYPFSKGLSHWLRKHDLYSTMEARLIVTKTFFQSPSIHTALLSRNFDERRLHQKALFYNLPARPIVKLLYMLLVRGAILDGPAGVTYSILQSIYEYLIVLKTAELRSANSDRHDSGLRGLVET